VLEDNEQMAMKRGEGNKFYSKSNTVYVQLQLIVDKFFQ
jgi:hypothetical protein